jgi:hypothetical protein
VDGRGPRGALALATAAGAAAGGDPAPFGLGLRALTDARSTELALTVTPASAGLDTPATLKHVQIKTFAPDGSLADVAKLTDVATTAGRRSIELPPLRRGQRIQAQVQLQDEQTVRTLVLDDSTDVLLRPDLRSARSRRRRAS